LLSQNIILASDTPSPLPQQEGFLDVGVRVLGLMQGGVRTLGVLSIQGLLARVMDVLEHAMHEARFKDQQIIQHDIHHPEYPHIDVVFRLYFVRVICPDRIIETTDEAETEESLHIPKGLYLSRVRTSFRHRHIDTQPNEIPYSEDRQREIHARPTT